jgi:hypothetical protein
MCVFVFLSLREYESVIEHRRLTHVLCAPKNKNKTPVQNNDGLNLAKTRHNVLPEMQFTC